jgi:hypothetical protein
MEHRLPPAFTTTEVVDLNNPHLFLAALVRKPSVAAPSTNWTRGQWGTAGVSWSTWTVPAKAQAMSLNTACLFGTTAGNIRVRDRNWTWNRHDCEQQSSNALLGDWMPIMTHRWLS